MTKQGDCGKKRKNPFLKPVQHRIEVWLFAVFLFVMRLIPQPKRADFLGNALAFIGPKTRANKRVLTNLAIGLPHLSAGEKREIARQAWDNLGRTYAEFTFGDVLSHPETGIIDTENYQEYERLRDSGRGIIMISAHYSNWELGPLYAGYHFDGFTGFYRRQNNALINAKINALRTATGAKLIAKNDKPALRTVLKHLRAGGAAGLLMDQNLDTGAEIPFLGVPARTMPIAYSLAKATGAAVLPFHLHRQPNGRYKCIVGNEVLLPETEDKNRAKAEFLGELNRIIGSWILHDPGQWFWMHKRWRHKDRTLVGRSTLDYKVKTGTDV